MKDEEKEQLIRELAELRLQVVGLEEKYNQVAKLAPALIWMSGPDKLCNYFNEQWLNFTGRMIEQELGNGWAEGVHPDDYEHCFNVYVTAFDDRKEFQLEYRLRRYDGEYRWILDIGTPRHSSEGEFLGYIGSCLDIHEQKELKHQLNQSQRMEALGTLAGGVAHEFNNILAAILGNTEMCIMELAEDSKEMQYLIPISNGVKHAANLVKQILTFSRMETTSLKPVNISIVVEDALQMVRSTLPANVEIRQNIQKDSFNVMADTTQIHQILLNLCINAYQAMEETGGVLKVSLKRIVCDVCPHTYCHDKSKLGCLELTVTDNGYGISSKDLNKIFDPFFTTKEVGKGTGLGLAMVHGIIEKHHGQITVGSEIGKGSTFKIFFPAVKEEEIPLELIKDDFVRKGEGHILIVEDEPSLVRMYQTFLEKLGYGVTICGNGYDALQFFKENPSRYDLVFTDQAMPNMTGKQLSQELLKIQPGVPIILYTGHSDAISEEEAIAIGIRKYFMKPVELKTLSQTIEECLKE